MPTIDLKQCTLTIQDGTGTPLSITVKIGEGNLTYTEAQAREYILDRGQLSNVRNGDDTPLEVSFDFVWEYITASSGGTETVEDALKQVGEASSCVSTDTDECNPYAVDLIFEFTPTPSTCGDKETITFPDFRWESLEHDAQAGQISVSGKCNVTSPTVVRAAQT